MRLHRFYVNTPIETGLMEIADERLLHQWKNVFRYGEGSEAILFDGSGFEYQARLKKLENRGAQVEIISKKEGIVPDKKITLYQSLIKKDKMEWIAEKATELGVSKIVPIISERSEKKDLNLERIRKIVIEASEQCGRADVPEMEQIASLEKALSEAKQAVVFDASGDSLEPKTKNLKRELGPKTLSSKLQALSLFIGPEGGWSEREIELFKQKEAEVCILGPLTLRAETAAIVVLAQISILE